MTSSNAEVLASLGNWLAPGDLSEILSKLLRVPEAWNQLHDPEFLANVLDAEAEEKLLPAALASLMRDANPPVFTNPPYQDNSDLSPSPFWEEMGRLSIPERDFKVVAWIADEFIRQIQLTSLDGVTEHLIGNPMLWRSPLACAWPYLPESDDLLKALLTKDPRTGTILAINALLVNGNSETAAEHLLNAMAQAPRFEVLDVLQYLEPETYNILCETAHDSGQPETLQDAGDSLEARITQALIAQAQGDAESAAEILQVAGELSTSYVARIEDFKAQASHSTEDHQQELLAWQRANAFASTPRRRAMLALCMSELGKPIEAKAELLSTPESFEEQIALGLLQSDVGEDDLALMTLQSAAQWILDEPKYDIHWMDRLVGGLIELGDLETTLKLDGAILDVIPSNSEKITAYSRRLLEAGDPISAAENAHIALALSPSSTETHRVLASSLEESGNAAEALAHWTAIAENDADAQIQVARCAYKAGFLDLTIHFAEEILSQDPESIDGLILMGQALTADGKFEEARSQLERATDLAPNNPETWIALADHHHTCGDIEAAGRTLAAAVQLIPGSVEVLQAYADWLKEQGRLSEALEYAEQANNLQPKNFYVQVTYGEALLALGHKEKALPILRYAVSQKPANWLSLQALARTYEEIGDLPKAVETINKLTELVPSRAKLLAARIFLRAAQASGDMSLVKRGKAFLSTAMAKGLSDPIIGYWQAFAEELEGNHLQALQGYQASAKDLHDRDPEMYHEAALGIARTALETDQAPLSIQTLQDLHGRFPASIPGMVLLSEALIKSGEQEEAIGIVKHALTIDPCNREALRQIATIASETNSWDLATDAIQKMVELNPENPRAWIIFAENAQASGNTLESRTALARALWINRQDPQLLEEVSNVLKDMGEAQSSKRVLQRAMLYDPQNPILLKQFAEAAEAAGDLEAAQMAWCRSAQSESENPETLNKAAEALWKMGEKQSAIELWSSAYNLETTDLAALRNLTMAYLAQGDLEAARRMNIVAMRKDPGNLELIVAAARGLILSGAPHLAHENLQKALRRSPTDELLVAYADCLIQIDQPEPALEVLESVMDKEQPPELWYSLYAIASAKIGNLTQAHSILTSASEIEYRNSDAVISHSYAAVLLGLWDDSIRILNQPVEKDRQVDLLLAEAYARIRSLELNDIYSQAEASAHSPTNLLTDEDSSARILQLLEAAGEYLAPLARLNELQFRAELLSHTTSSSSTITEEILASPDLSVEKLEAACLASLRTGNTKEALELLARRDDIDHEGIWFDIIAGLCQQILGHNELARQAYSTACENLLIQPLARFFLAKEWLAAGEETKAIGQLNSAIALWPDETAWQYQLGALYLDADDPDSALPHLQEAVELDPGNSTYATCLARVYRDTGHLSQSMNLYDQVLQSNPSDGRVWSEAGDLALANGDPRSAESYFEQANTLIPSDPQILVGMSKAALSLDKTKAALDWIKTAVQLAPEDPDVLIATGEIFASQGKFDKAIASYEVAMSKASNPLPVQMARCRLLIKAGRAEEAVAELSKILEKDQAQESAWAAYAEAYEAAGDLNGALEAASKAVNLAPNNPSYRMLLGSLCRKAGQLDRALDELSQVEHKNPTNAQVLLEMGYLYEDRRQLRYALDAYQRAISIDKNLIQAYFRSGILLKQFKSYSDAGEMLSRAVELDPKNPEALHQLAAVRALELVHGGIPQTVVST
ncbi:MAG: tetratricopeptide repeat protein [Anaerolineales bacterium]|nr:tetratricopeptide repeat protein [Anaerolineales bacterium]